jgi:hypothetical protein
VPSTTIGTCITGYHLYICIILFINYSKSYNQVQLILKNPKTIIWFVSNGMPSSNTIWNALIRTHHITSRKKVSKLRTAASHHNVFALLRSGGCPGIMYCEGSEPGVKEWVATVQRLRYKDFQLAIKPAAKQIAESQVPSNRGVTSREYNAKEDVMGVDDRYGKLDEIESVKEYGMTMERMGLWNWWRKGMGYVQSD